LEKLYTAILTVIAFTATAQTTNTFPASGNVGIGTLSPLADFHVNGNMRWGGYGTNFLYSGQDGIGAYLEQVGDNSAKSRMRLQTSVLGTGQNYSVFTIDPEKGFSFVSWGAGNSNVGIGTTDTKGYKLAVAGNMIAESVKVSLQANWPDYVFAKEYPLPTLQETEKHIKEKGHLPGIPSAAEAKANGIDLGVMNAKLLQKIEELTLHLIEQCKANNNQTELIKALQETSKNQQKEINQLKNKL